MEPPTRIGAWTLGRPLGRGGAGKVYLATHQETGDEAALKWLFRGDPQSFVGMRREIRALAGLQHPGVVQILDHGVEQGIPWYVMPRLEGPHLGAWARTLGTASWSNLTVEASSSDSWAGGTTFTLDDMETERTATSRVVRVLRPGQLQKILNMVRRVCDALAYLHGEGFVHRDLKPGNVMLSAAQEPVLVDFGLVRRHGTDAARETWLEMPGRVAGTPAYMSPEQIRGESLDGRADLYALGCLLYSLVAGRPPFAGSWSNQILQAHLHQQPTPLCQRVSDIPQPLDDLVLRLLSKARADRPSSALEVADALEALGAPPRQPHAPVPRLRLYRTEFTGRSDALEALRKWSDASQDSGGVVAVVGPTGIGKTRLVSHWVGMVVRAERVRTISCSPSGEGMEGGPLSGVSGVTEYLSDAIAGGQSGDLAEILGSHGRALAPFLKDAHSLPDVAELPDLPTLPEGASRERLFRVLLGALTRLDHKAPLMVVVDDLHLMDPLSIQWLVWLSRRPGLKGIRVVVTWNLSAQDVMHPLFPDELKRVELGRLEDQHVARMADSMLGARVPEKFRRWLRNATEGIPLRVGAYLRLALDQNQLTRAPSGHWRWSGQTRWMDMPVPERLRASLSDRVQRLDEAHRVVAEAAAVVGRTGTLEDICTLVEQSGEAVEDAVRQLVMVGVLEQPSPDTFQFGNSLLREVTVDGIAPERLVEMHRIATLAIEAGQTEGEPVDWGRLAHHRERSLQLDAAREAYLKAAQHCKPGGPLGFRTHLLSRWLVLDDGTSVETTVSVLVDLIRAQQEVGDPVEPTLERLQTVLEHKGCKDEPLIYCDGRLARVRARYVQGRFDEAKQEAEEVLQDLLALSESPRRARLLSRAYSSIAGVMFYLGEPEQSLPMREQSLRWAQICEAEDAVIIEKTMIGQLHTAMGEVDAAERYLLEAERLAIQADRPIDIANAAAGLSWLWTLTGRFEQALAILDRADHEVARADWVRGLWLTPHMRGTLWVLQGKEVEAEALCQHADWMMDVVAQDALANDETLALAHLSRGRLDEAFALFSEVREGLFEMGPAVPWIDGWTLPFLAHVAEVIGDMETATELVEQMLARPRTLCHWGGVLVGAAVRRRTGDLEGAGELLTEAEQRAPVLGHSWLGSWLHSERGLLALALGQDPLPHLDRCRENIEELGDLMDHALPLVRLRVLEEAVSAAR